MPNFHYVNNELVQLTDAEEAAFKADQDRHAADIAANGYKEDRASEYPSVVDQLDLIYHSGIDAWKAKIKETKDKYPKP